MAHLFLFFAESTDLGAGASSDHALTIFILEIVLLLFFGRLLGEIMQRFGQPAVMGQIIAGVILGPSIFGHLSPSVYGVVFPNDPVQKKMIDAVSQLGIMMLLLLTGIETDLKLVNRMRRTAIFTSLSGIIFPFACGYILGQYLPDSVIPDPSRRLVTSLFLATALSISSVKIVAMVIMEVGFLRRNVGQIILASAILDDTIGWIIIAIIGGIASSGTVNLSGAAFAFIGTIVFLAVSFTLGRRAVAYAIRWTNDNMIMEMPVITAILVITLGMALLTQLIGVHTVLGAFVVGILVGQSPILTKHIEEQLRGLIVALFAPVFFAVAGREIDLTLLNSAYQLELAAGLILIASVGKIVGAYIGGRLGKMNNSASIALAIGMNARGSTEVIVATIGLSLGVLNRDLFTLIVVMAVTTTLVTPPLLRWALRRIPPTGEEKQRLEREESEAKEFVPNIERVLIAADNSDNGMLASLLAGFFSGAQKLMTTVLEFQPSSKPNQPNVLEIADTPAELAQTSAEAGAEAADEKEPDTDPLPPILVNEEGNNESSEAVLKEIEKGYDLLFIGVAGAPGEGAGDEAGAGAIAPVLDSFTGVTAIAIWRGRKHALTPDIPLNILLPITGTDYSQKAAEIAVAIAKGSGGTLTAYHVAPPAKEVDVLRRPDELVTAGHMIVRAIRELGKRNGVKVRPVVRERQSPEVAILKRMGSGKYNLLVLGVKAHAGRSGPHFGRLTAVLLEKSKCPVLLVNS